MKKVSMDHGRRIALLKGWLKKLGVDSFLVTDETNVSYLSGFYGHDAMLLVTTRNTFLLTDGRYFEEAKRSSGGIAVELVTDSTYTTIADIARRSRLKRLGFEDMDLPYGIAKRLQDILAGTRLIPARDAVEQFRAVKDPGEIGAIRGSIRLTKRIFSKALGLIRRPGVTEESLAREIEIRFIAGGARPAFDPIVAAGVNSSRPHATPSGSRIKRDSFVMIDVGGRLDGYCSDMTRTILTGAISDRFARIYTAVRTAQRNAIRAIRAGARISEADFAARSHISRQGFGKFFCHSLGHGVGLDIHEQPTVSSRNKGFFRSGMVVTVEPAIYIPGFGGVRIEDMVLVTDKGCEILT